jgi:hypothetical protein
MITDYFDTTWGIIRLFCSAIVTDNSRKQVVHELATGDVHPVQDRGLVPRKTRCSLLFDEMPGESKSAFDRFLEFKAQVDRGDDAIFTHPIDGSYLAKVGEFTYEIDEDSNIVNAVAEFIANDEITAVRPSAVGSAAATGVDDVEARADELRASLDAYGIESTAPELAKTTVDGWSSGESVPTRDVMNQTAELVEAIGQMIELEGLEDDIELWPVYVSAIMLGDSIRAAALAVTSEAPAVFVMRVAVPTSVLALVLRIYPAVEAEDRERQVRELNDLRTPSGLISAGTDLIMPSTSSSARAV